MIQTVTESHPAISSAIAIGSPGHLRITTPSLGQAGLAGVNTQAIEIVEKRPLKRGNRQEDAAIVVRLLDGEVSAWDQFVETYSGAIFGAVANTLRKSGRNMDDSTDIAQDVYVRLCKNDFRLLKQYDSQRAGLKTWLGVISSSATIDHLRKLRGSNIPLEDLPEEVGSVEPETHDPIKIPDGLLSARQALVLQLLYDKDMDAGEVAAMLGIDSQTVRSTHHKALVKLRKYFALED